MGEVIQSVVSQAGGGGEIVNFLVMMVAMFAILYFMMIRPQRKQQAQHQQMLSALKKGDEVILASGIYGRIYAVEDQTILVEIADRTRIKVLKSAVSSVPAARAGAKVISAGSESSSTAVPAADEAEPQKSDRAAKKR